MKSRKLNFFSGEAIFRPYSKGKKFRQMGVLGWNALFEIMQGGREGERERKRERERESMKKFSNSLLFLLSPYPLLPLPLSLSQGCAFEGRENSIQLFWGNRIWVCNNFLKNTDVLCSFWTHKLPRLQRATPVPNQVLTVLYKPQWTFALRFINWYS